MSLHCRRHAPRNYLEVSFRLGLESWRVRQPEGSPLKPEAASGCVVFQPEPLDRPRPSQRRRAGSADRRGSGLQTSSAFVACSATHCLQPYASLFGCLGFSGQAGSLVSGPTCQASCLHFIAALYHATSRTLVYRTAQTPRGRCWIAGPIVAASRVETWSKVRAYASVVLTEACHWKDAK